MGRTTTLPTREKFLVGLAAGMRVSAAAAAAGLSRARAYELQKTDAAFAAAWRAALARARPVPVKLPPFDPRDARDGRLALLLKCHPPEHGPLEIDPDAAEAPPCREATAAAKSAFLDALAAGLTVSQAARGAGLSRNWVYALKARDQVFAAAWQEISDDIGAYAQSEARRRVFGGTGVLAGAGVLSPGARFDAGADQLLIALAMRGERGLETLGLSGPRSVRQFRRRDAPPGAS